MKTLRASVKANTYELAIFSRLTGERIRKMKYIVLEVVVVSSTCNL